MNFFLDIWPIGWLIREWRRVGEDIELQDETAKIISYNIARGHTRQEIEEWLEEVVAEAPEHLQPWMRENNKAAFKRYEIWTGKPCR